MSGPIRGQVRTLPHAATRRGAARTLLGLLGLAVVLAVTAAAQVATAPPVAAHAVLQSTSPADRAALEAAPAAVTLEFNEAVSAPLGAVRAFDGTGERVDLGDLDVQDGVLTLGLRPDLGDGSYVVTYRVLSSDAHPITGAFTFVVGDASQATDDTVAGLLGSGDDRTWDVVGGAARGFAYTGALLAAGLGVFLVAAHDGGSESARLRRVLRAGAAAGAAGMLVAIPVSAARVTGVGLGAITEEGVLGEVLQDGVWQSTAVVLAGLAALVIVPRAGSARAPARRAFSLVGAIAATAGFALAGHTTTADPRWVVTVSDAVHAAAGAVWFGGLVGLAVVLRTRRGDAAATAAGVVGRFSSIAAVALLAVAACGVLVGWREVRTIDALTSTTYGRVLLVKVGLVGVVAALGGWNRARLVPAMTNAPRAAAERLHRAVRVEAGVLVAAIAITAALVNVTPAATAAGIGGIFSDTVALGDGSVNVVVDPNRAGANEIHLYVFDAAGRVSNAAFDEITLRLSLPAAEIGPLERTPFLAGPGHFQLDGSDLSISGDWTIEVVARVDTFDQLTATVDVAVNP